MKIISMGFLFNAKDNSRAYLRYRWNLLDFCVIIVKNTRKTICVMYFWSIQGSALASFGADNFPSVRSLRFLQALRALRILEVVAMAQSMRVNNFLLVKVNEIYDFS